MPLGKNTLHCHSFFPTTGPREARGIHSPSPPYYQSYQTFLSQRICPLNPYYNPCYCPGQATSVIISLLTGSLHLYSQLQRNRHAPLLYRFQVTSRPKAQAFFLSICEAHPRHSVHCGSPRWHLAPSLSFYVQCSAGT